MLNVTGGTLNADGGTNPFPTGSAPYLVASNGVLTTASGPVPYVGAVSSNGRFAFWTGSITNGSPPGLFFALR